MLAVWLLVLLVGVLVLAGALFLAAHPTLAADVDWSGATLAADPLTASESLHCSAATVSLLLLCPDGLEAAMLDVAALLEEQKEPG